MKTSSTPPNFISGLSKRFSRDPLKMGAPVLLLCMGFLNGCMSDDPGIVNLCIIPTVTRTSPAQGDSDVSLDKAGATFSVARVSAVKIISASFSTPMDPSTINTSTFIVRQGTDSIVGMVSYTDTTALFIVPTNLAPNLTYTCTITTGVKSRSGGPLAANYVWSFTTIAPGTPKLVFPANFAVNQPSNPTLTWNAIAGANSYRLQVSLSPSFIGTVYDDSNRVDTSQQMSGLVSGDTYYWRVNSKTFGTTSAYSTVWRFTVGTATAPVVNLGLAANFGSMGGSAGITNQGTLTRVNGDISTTGASTLITGFHDATAPPSNVFTETPLNIGAVSDTIYTATAPPGSVAGAVATQSLAAAQSAFNYLKGLPPGNDPGAGELGGLTLAPGTYTAALGTFKITLLDLTLDAKGDPNAQFVFQMASSLTVGAASGARNVILINGAQAKNVFWVTGTGGSGAATINGAGGGTMVGNIISYSGVTFSTVGNTSITTLNGRALGLNGSVTLVNTVINVPSP